MNFRDMRTFETGDLDLEKSSITKIVESEKWILCHLDSLIIMKVKKLQYFIHTGVVSNKVMAVGFYPH